MEVKWTNNLTDQTKSIFFVWGMSLPEAQPSLPLLHPAGLDYPVLVSAAW